MLLRFLSLNVLLLPGLLGHHAVVSGMGTDFSPLSCNANLTVADCDATGLTLSSVLDSSLQGSGNNGTAAAEAIVPCGMCATATVSDGSTLAFPSGLNVEGMLYIPPSASLTIEATRIVVQGTLKIEPPAEGNAVRFAMINPPAPMPELEYFSPHPDNAAACDAATGCPIGKRAVAVAGGTLDVLGTADPASGGSCPGYVPLLSVSGSGESVFGRVEAEEHDAAEGINTYDDTIGYFNGGDWMTYHDVDLGDGDAPANSIRIRFSKVSLPRFTCTLHATHCINLTELEFSVHCVVSAPLRCILSP